MSPSYKLMSFFTKPWVMVTAVLLISLSFFFVDRPLTAYVVGLDLRHNLSFLNWFTKLGLGVLYFAVFTLAALFFRYIRKNPEWEARCWFLFLCVFIPSVICGVLKVLIGRARPSMWLEGQFYGFYGLQTKAPFWSFPSGHTTTIMGAAIGLSIIFPRASYALLTTGFLVALSRILLAHHYLSDVLAAAYLVFVEIAIMLWYLRRKSWLEPAWKVNYNSEKRSSLCSEAA